MRSRQCLCTHTQHTGTELLWTGKGVENPCKDTAIAALCRCVPSPAPAPAREGRCLQWAPRGWSSSQGWASPAQLPAALPGVWFSIGGPAVAPQHQNPAVPRVAASPGLAQPLPGAPQDFPLCHTAPIDLCRALGLLWAAGGLIGSMGMGMGTGQVVPSHCSASHGL